MNARISIFDEVGSDVSSRSKGAVVRRKVIEFVEEGHKPVTLDFAGVRTVSGSFADEVIGVLTLRGEEWFRSHVRIEGLNEGARTAIREAIFERQRATMR